MKPAHFFIEQVALCPKNPEKAKALLTEMGLGDWCTDMVKAEGEVYSAPATNDAELSFNYTGIKAYELEILDYQQGDNWVDESTNSNRNVVSHLGMHCTENDLIYWKAFFGNRGIRIAQEVNTLSHTNPQIKDSRRYHYVIFDTRDILGTDVKFIVRKNINQ